MDETVPNETKELIDELKLKCEAAAVDRGENKQEIDAKKCYKNPNDGTEYEWDEQKRAWFPKVSEIK